MIKSLWSTGSEQMLEKSLQASSLRHKVISNNIANANTPGFKRSDVPFDEILQRNMKQEKLPIARTHEQHFAVTGNKQFEPSILTDGNTSLRSDGNNVDIDVEMANLAKNNIYYDAIAQQISRYFSNLKSAINEGRR